MKNISLFVSTLVAISLLTLACNKASLLGSELFEGDKLNLKFTDSLTIQAINENPESIVMYEEGGIQAVTLPIGKLPDNFFGTTEAQLFTNFSNAPIPSLKDSIPLRDSIIDSVRLVLPYAAGLIYGDTTAEQEFAVYRLTEKLDGKNINSAKTFAHEPTAIGRVRFFPQPNTAQLEKRDTSSKGTKIDTISPYLSIILPIALGKELLGDTNKLKFNAATGLSGIADMLKGFVIKAEKSAPCILNFNISGAASPRPAGIYVHYRAIGDTVQRQVVFTPYGTIRYSHYKHSYATAPVKDFLNDVKKGDSLLTVEGFAGAYSRLEFPDLKKLGKILVNKAELEIFVKEDPTQKAYGPTPQLILLNGNSKALEEKRYLGLTDVIADALDFSPASTSLGPFTNSGGYPYYASTDTSVRRYKLPLSIHFQAMVDGKASPQLILYPQFKAFYPARTVFFGPKHPKYRAKLNLTYTKLD